ncbi:MAG: tyrosine-type recombinase/integrase [Oscillospiraceae bacterium]|nr:tyrosine-type recombinase/integrase [Oscillospiraceae bacterium]
MDLLKQQQLLSGFRDHLLREEKSPVTVRKYVHDVGAFFAFAQEQPLSKELLLEWKRALQQEGRALSSINSMLASVNSYLRYAGREDCRVRYLRAQREVYCAEDRELTEKEYRRLLAAAEKKPRLHLLLQTICSTGIRISELRFFTVQAVLGGEVTVRCKEKTRRILLPRELRRRLLDYARESEIASGAIFRTRGGRELDRSDVWKEMKALCAEAGVDPRKVYPHNLRKLFARSFYALDRDIARLADLLGHSSINTTRIYVMTSAREHMRQLDRMNLLADEKNTT